MSEYQYYDFRAIDREREELEKSIAPEVGQTLGRVALKTVSEQMVPPHAPLPN